MVTNVLPMMIAKASGAPPARILVPNAQMMGNVARVISAREARLQTVCAQARELMTSVPTREINPSEHVPEKVLPASVRSTFPEIAVLMQLATR
jgi:hypothetical protein